MKALTIGSRASNLARIQAEMVRDKLSERDPGLEISIKTYKTTGDIETSIPLYSVSATGVFVKELEMALLSGEIDLAVHSLKDMPSTLPDGLMVAAVLQRDDPRDALLTAENRAGGSILPQDVVGTSSLRRKAQLLRNWPELEIIDIRGNIETRIAKLESGLCSATILASCGLDRAGYRSLISHRFSYDEMLPAPCQGIISVETKAEAHEIRAVVAPINHRLTMISATVERAFLRAVDGGCRVPVACLSSIDGATLTVTGLVAAEDGAREIRKSASGDIPQGEEIAEELARVILADGGEEILASYERRR